MRLNVRRQPAHRFRFDQVQFADFQDPVGKLGDQGHGTAKQDGEQVQRDRSEHDLILVHKLQSFLDTFPGFHSRLGNRHGFFPDQ